MEAGKREIIYLLLGNMEAGDEGDYILIVRREYGGREEGDYILIVRQEYGGRGRGRL